MTGRHFLQIPGPTNVPDRVLQAIGRPTIDHRGPDFAELTHGVLAGLKKLCDCSGDVFLYPASGTGAWEAALVNTTSPGDTVLMYETGHFAKLWSELAQNLGLKAQIIPGSWRSGADANAIADALKQDPDHQIRAVCVVHNETSTGCVSPIDDVRAALDATGHPALLLVDTISSLGSIPYSHDRFGADVTIGCSQKGLMLPPGLSFNAVGAKAMEAAKQARMVRSYWSWPAMAAANRSGAFPYTPSTNLLFGLREALAIFEEEGLASILARHSRHAAATRAAVAAWGLETVCTTPNHHSSSLTAVFLPEGHSADAFRAVVLKTFNMSLGNGLSRLADKVFRIGHLGDFNDLMLAGTLSGVEMGLALCQAPHRAGGVQAALAHLQKSLP
ncbi:MAG: serine--glyoxylate aminotransferase [Rhizobiales bacterium 62-17]|nr:MAG: serine--glyoxylate aminotransferase [Rhizobiales bacterium 62-17]